MTLLGAPDGTADFDDWDPRPAPATSPASPSANVPAQDKQDTDFQL